MNYLRNVALRRANTEYVFLLDVDFLPMMNLYNYAQQLLKSTSSIASKLGIAEDKKMVCDTFMLHFYISPFLLGINVL